MLASLGQYIYSVNESEVYVHLFIGEETSFTIDEQTVSLHQVSNYPWEGRSKLTLGLEKPATFTVAPRLPGWCRNVQILVNGEVIDTPVEKGYAKIKQEWDNGDIIELLFDMPVEIVRSHPEVRANAGKVALQRGPMLYCLEEVDNGANLQDLRIKSDQSFDVAYEKNLLKGVTVIRGKAFTTDKTAIEDTLYTTSTYPEIEKEITAIPYYAWSNRGENEMTVWNREK